MGFLFWVSVYVRQEVPQVQSAFGCAAASSVIYGNRRLAKRGSYCLEVKESAFWQDSV